MTLSLAATIIAALGSVLVGLGAFTFVQARRIEARYPPIGELVDIGGGAIHVVETPAEGRERGVALLAHGASGNFADMSVALAERLGAEGFRVLSFDRPGHGWSARLFDRAASSPERQAEMLREAAERRGVRQAIVVAHSLAGVIGLAMALNAPQFVRGLVLVSPVSHPWPGGVGWYYPIAAHPFLGALFRRLLLMPLGLAMLGGGVRGVFAPNPIPPQFIERTRVPLVLRPENFRFNAEDVVDLAAAVAALAPRYGAIRAPTAIVTGDRDGVVYADIHSVGCARDIPGASLKVLEGVGHSPHHTAPHEVVAAILDVDRRAREREAQPAAPASAEA